MLEDHTDNVTSAKFNNECDKIITASFDNHVYIYNAED